MSSSENAAILRRMFEEAYNQRDEAVFDELVSPRYFANPSGHAVGAHLETQTGGPETLKQTVRWLASAFPDFRMEVADIVSEDDKVWVHTVFTGSHTGEFLGVAPTGRRVEANQVHMWRLEDGKIAEHRAVRDDLTLFIQVGAVPAPGGPAPPA
jgi:predicted ester cyclase